MFIYVLYFTGKQDKEEIKITKTDYDNSDTIIQAEVEICFSKWIVFYIQNARIIRNFISLQWNWIYIQIILSINVNIQN